MATEYKYIPIVYRKNDRAYKDMVQKKRPVRRVSSVYEKPAFASASRISADAAAVAAKPVITPVSREKVKSVASTIAVIVFVFVMLALVVAGNATISSMNIENAAISDEITQLEQDIDSLQLDIALATDLENIQTRAAQLGMTVPDSTQIAYVQSAG